MQTPSATGDCADPRAVNFTYTATGRRQTMSDPSGQTVYNYDDRDRLHTKQTPFGTLTYTYDNIGNVQSITSSNANGAAMGYTYDEANRLATVTVPGQAPTTYGYDAAGNLESVANPNGTTATYTYNLLNRLTRMATTTANTAVASYQYTLGAAGNRKSVTELSGRTVNYGYDDAYRLTLETISGAVQQNGAIGYVYDAVGNRKTMSSTVAALPPGLWNYDANDRITTDTYDDNGNTIADAGTQNVYDFENHLTQRGGVTIVYDGDGNRVSETVAGVTTNYLVDNENPTGYAQVVEELQNGQVVRSYMWGHWLISATQQINSKWKTSYYGYDGHGSVRFLTDTSGTVTDTYDYDAFGNLISSTGNTPNNYLFAGEQFDPALNLYYNRARYLDVRTGRFWGMDTYEGVTQDPRSLHRYLYASDDPVNNADPSGKFTVAEALTVAAVVTVLAVAAYFTLRPHPVRLSLDWKTNFWWTNWRGQKHSQEGPLASNEVNIIKTLALETLKQAFAVWGVPVMEGRGGNHVVEVTPRLVITGCGQTRYSPSSFSYVSYGCVMNRAQFAVSPLERPDVIPAIGRGIGNISAHEVGHQLGLSLLAEDSEMPGKYEGGNDSDPSIYDGTGQEWTGKSKQELPEKLH